MFMAKGIPFIDKAHSMYTSEEKYELAKWALENIDYDMVSAELGIGLHGSIH